MRGDPTHQNIDDVRGLSLGEVALLQDSVEKLSTFHHLHHHVHLVAIVIHLDHVTVM